MDFVTGWKNHEPDNGRLSTLLFQGFYRHSQRLNILAVKWFKKYWLSCSNKNINKRVWSKEETLTTGLDEESFNQCSSSTVGSRPRQPPPPPDPMLAVGAWAPPHVTLLHVASCPETHWGSVPPHARGKPADHFTPPSSSSCRLWGWAQGEKKENLLLSNHQASARDCRH